MDPGLETAIGGGVAGIILGALYLLIQCCKNRESRCSSLCFDLEIRNARTLQEIHRTITNRGERPPDVANLV